MRIVFLNPGGALGGAETALLDLLAAVRHARPDWALALVAAAEGPLTARAGILGVGAEVLPFPPSVARLGEWGARGGRVARVRLLADTVTASAAMRGYAKRLRAYLADRAPDIVHTNGLKMHLIGAHACPPGARLVWHLHDYPAARPLGARLLAAHVRRCATMLANSESVATQARERFGSGVPVRTLYNSLDLDRFHPDGPRTDLDALAGLPPPAPGTLRVGLVGTFARWKGQDVFLEALSRLRTTTAVRGYLVGEAIYQTEGSQFSRQQLRALADSLDLGDAVGFTGHTDDIPAVLRALDVVVHASVEPEPFGLVIAEAMACGRPVVVSRAGGAAEIAQAGTVFHEPGNATDLADRMRELAVDPPRRAALGIAGRQAAMRLFSRERLCETLIPVYESLARTPRS